MGIKGTSRKGDISEYEVIIYFLKQGYEVFKNVGCTGYIDIIVVCPKTKEITCYDVKTTSSYIDKKGGTTIYGNATTEEQRKFGVELVAMHEGKVYTDPIIIKERVK